MTIDWEKERVIPLRDVTKHVKSRSSGKKLSVATAWRWALKRQNPLETFRTPGGRFTSVEAISRFLDRCTSNLENQSHRPLPVIPSDCATSNERSAEAALELKKLIGGK